MRNFKRLTALALLPFLLTGCSQSYELQELPEVGSAVQTGVPQTGVPQAASEMRADERECLSASGVLPVLAIETKAQPGSLDFVTEPVAEHVARSIASWTPGYRMPPAPYYEACTVSLTDTGENVLLAPADADVKVRGNWTTSYDKKPLRIKFAAKQNLLGLSDGAAFKNWVLLAEYKDTSMLRNKTALSIAEEILETDGLFTSDAALVEVTINGAYWGVYLLAEYQQINPGRIDASRAEKGYTGTDIGYFLEFDGYYTEEMPDKCFFVDYADNAPLVPFDGTDGSGRTMCPLNEGRSDAKQDVGITIKSDIYSQEQHDFIANFVNNTYRILYAAAYEDKAYCFDADFASISETSELTPREAIEAVADVQSLADMYIVSELTCDADIYWSSFFMDVDFGEGGDRRLRFEAPWDFDSSLGNKDRCADGTGFYAANIIPDVNDTYETINPWLAVLMNEDWFREIIREKWTAAYDGGVFERAYTAIEQDARQYASAFERNYERWDNLRHNEAANEWTACVRKCRTHQETTEYLEEWLRKRVEFLNDYWHA